LDKEPALKRCDLSYVALQCGHSIQPENELPGIFGLLRWGFPASRKHEAKSSVRPVRRPVFGKLIDVQTSAGGRTGAVQKFMSAPGWRTIF
jgi:hypothetical protein